MTIRNFARNRLLDILGLFAKPQPGVHILNGHMLSRGTATETDAKTFENLLDNLSKNAKFIRFEKATELIASKATVNEPLIAFSFDDGFDECIAIAEVLEKFRTNASFFINPNFAKGDPEYIRNFTESIVLTPGKKPLTADKIKLLANRNHIIGAHTLDHYMINTNDRNILEQQIGQCKEEIEKISGQECRYFAFPYGKLEHANNLAIEIACKHYPYVFSQSDYKNYFSFEGKVINRRHFEPFWPVNHVNYFLDCKKK